MGVSGGNAAHVKPHRPYTPRQRHRRPSRAMGSGGRRSGPRKPQLGGVCQTEEGRNTQRPRSIRTGAFVRSAVTRPGFLDTTQ